MTRLWLGLLRALHALLPFSVLAWLGERLGGLLYYASASRRRIGRTNLQLCFPDGDKYAIRRTLRAHFRALGRATLLESVSWWGSRAELERGVRIEGQEHLTAVAGRPVILLAPHFVGLNLGGVRVTAWLAPIVSLYASIKNPPINTLMLHARTRFVGPDGTASEMYSRHDGIKPVLRALKKGRPFYYLPDMDYGPKDAIFVPFFGVPAATITALPRLAEAAGAVVVPCVTRWEAGPPVVAHSPLGQAQGPAPTGWPGAVQGPPREPSVRPSRGKKHAGRPGAFLEGRYVVRLYQAWEGYPSDDIEADTRRMNAFIEDRVREMPEQYFWLHKRFKTRPEGQPSLYD